MCLCIIGALFGSVAILNLIQPNRPTESEAEQRELAEMPEFSLEALKDGTYFSDLSLFVSDTFLYRDQLVSLSKKMDTLKGVDYSIGGEDSFVLLDSQGGKTSESENELNDKLLSVLENLNNGDKTGENTADTDTENETTPPIDEDTQSAVGEIVEEETEIPETETTDQEESASDPADETETQESAVQEDDTVVTAIHLSKKSLKLTVGSGAVVSASIETSNNQSAKVKWSISDKSIATIAMNPNGGIDVKGVAVGSATLTCSWNGIVTETCEITVSEVIVGQPQANGEADFLTNGMFIYGDAVYTQGYYSESASKTFAQTALYYKQLFGENTRVSTVVIPVSAMVIDSPDVTNKITDQKSLLDKMSQWFDPSVNFVNVYEEMYSHRDEYLYFKSDHHWTQRGAYYAYRAFAESVGLEPTPLEDFDYGIHNDSYNGSLYQYTHDERVKTFIDTIETFNSRKEYTMTVTTSNGYTFTTDSAIVQGNKTYANFISGDNPYTVINVPENPQDKNILVLKDSFGNAFVPFLCEHYGNIFVVDVRYSAFNLHEHLSDNGITDIVFVNNVQAANSVNWSRMYLGAVGVSLE